MDFDQIAKELGITKREAIKAYESAMKKLKMPSKDNQRFWEYINILLRGDNKDGIISAE
jgi:hypothetical protein